MAGGDEGGGERGAGWARARGKDEGRGAVVHQCGGGMRVRYGMCRGWVARLARWRMMREAMLGSVLAVPFCGD